MKHVTLISYECLSAVSSLILTCHYTEPVIDLESFRILLRLLPSLTYLNMRMFHTTDPNEDHLVALSAMRHLRLRTIILDGSRTKYESIVLLIRSFGSSLEDFDAQRINATTLKLLVSTCTKMKKLSFTCEGIEPEALISILGAGNCPLLEIAIAYQWGGDNTPEVNDDIVLALSTNHPELQVITVHSGSNITLSSVAAALTHVPHFRDLNTFLFRFRTVMAAQDSRELVELPYYELVIQESSMMENLRADLQLMSSAPFFKHKIRSFQTYGCTCSEDTVLEIIDVLGNELYILHLGLADDVSDGTLTRLLRECTELRTLYLDRCEAFTDDMVMLVADECHHVVFLSLAGAINITNTSVCYLLQLIGHRLVALYIEECSLLSNSTLIAIVEYCASLEWLNISYTGITTDAVIAHVIKPNHLVTFTVSEEMLDILKDFLGTDGGANLKKWQKALRYE